MMGKLGRRIVLIDIENIVGGAVRTSEEAAWGRTIIETLVEIRPGEHVVVGTCDVGALHVMTEWRDARVVMGTGENGADRQIIDVLTTENLASRFDEVLLISGDHIFAEPLAALRGLGMDVTVASWVSHLSPLLQLAAAHTIILDHQFTETYVEAA